ncbi:MAG: hypothetical protein AAF211_23965, partial [Myxococcota bacterium]
MNQDDFDTPTDQSDVVPAETGPAHLGMRARIEAFIGSDDNKARKHVHPRLIKMFIPASSNIL